MAPAKGNQFWKLRSSHGRKPIFATPDALWDAATEYFEWVEANPLYEMKAFSAGGAILTKKLPKMRAMTIGGLCLFLDIDKTTFAEYADRKGFEQTYERITSVIYTQKLEGAAADLLNGNIIARELGLRDKQDVDHSGAVRYEKIETVIIDPKHGHTPD